MEAKNDWVVLESFSSEVEARVVESFLRAQNLEVELLDTHMNTYMPTSTSLGRGMRLMIRALDVDRARELLLESQRGSHLEIVGEHVPVKRSPVEKWMMVLLIAAAAAVLLLTYFRPS